VNEVPVGGTSQTPRPKRDDGVSEVLVDVATKFVFKVSGAVPSESAPEHFLHPGQCMSGICYGIGGGFCKEAGGGDGGEEQQQQSHQNIVITILAATSRQRGPHRSRSVYSR
jgi:hypothetical protein